MVIFMISFYFTRWDFQEHSDSVIAMRFQFLPLTCATHFSKLTIVHSKKTLKIYLENFCGATMN